MKNSVSLPFDSDISMSTPANNSRIRQRHRLGAASAIKATTSPDIRELNLPMSNSYIMTPTPSPSSQELKGSSSSFSSFSSASSTASLTYNNSSDVDDLSLDLSAPVSRNQSAVASLLNDLEERQGTSNLTASDPNKFPSIQRGRKPELKFKPKRLPFHPSFRVDAHDGHNQSSVKHIIENNCNTKPPSAFSTIRNERKQTGTKTSFIIYDESEYNISRKSSSLRKEEKSIGTKSSFTIYDESDHKSSRSSNIPNKSFSRSSLSRPKLQQIDPNKQKTCIVPSKKKGNISSVIKSEGKIKRANTNIFCPSRQTKLSCEPSNILRTISYRSNN